MVSAVERRSKLLFNENARRLRTQRDLLCVCVGCAWLSSLFSFLFFCGNQHLIWLLSRFASFVPPKRWFQFKCSCMMNIDHICVAILWYVNSHVLQNCCFPMNLGLRDCHHCVSHHYLLQNNVFKLKFRVWWTLIILLLLVLWYVNSLAWRNVVFSLNINLRDRYNGVSHIFLQHYGFKWKFRVMNIDHFRSCYFCGMWTLMLHEI